MSLTTRTNRIAMHAMRRQIQRHCPRQIHNRPLRRRVRDHPGLTHQTEPRRHVDDPASVPARVRCLCDHLLGGVFAPQEVGARVHSHAGVECGVGGGEDGRRGRGLAVWGDAGVVDHSVVREVD